MRLLKRILMGLGLVVLLLGGAFASLLVYGWAGQGEQRAFAEAFVRDLSKDWNVADVRGRVAEEILPELDSPQAPVHQLTNLGRLRELSALTLRRHFITSEQTLRVFAFTASYEHGEAQGEVAVVDAGGRRAVRGFRIVPSGPVSTTRTRI